MSDELDRIRSLSGDAPAPSDEWVQDTRAELLAMAAEEEQERTSAAAAGPLVRLRERLAALVAGPRMAAAAGAVVLLAVVAVGVVLTVNQDQDSAAPIAGTTPSPQPTSEPQPTTSPQLEDGVVLASSCEGGDGTYTIGYPEGWHTNSGEVAEPCEFFDQQPVELEPQTGGAPEHPVVVDVLPVGFDRATDPGRAEQETSRTEATVAGRDAVIVEWISTGRGASPEGMRSYRYLIDLDGRTLMVAAHDLGDRPFDTYVQVVDAMAESLELARP